MNILLGVTGGIAAYKSCELCSLAIKNGHDVIAVMTESATRFVGTITFEGLTGNKVYTDNFETAMDHINLAKWADVVIVAPLTANSLAKIAGGLCDELLFTVLCATPTKTPVLLCPAMNTHMWNSPITQRNLKLLEETERYTIQSPVEKRLACGDFGVGGLPEPTSILKECERICRG